MRFKKFLIIPILIFLYIFLVNFFFANIGIPITIRQYSTSGPLTILSIGETISVVVTRSYYFGLIRLPAYNNVIGEVGGIHRYFFYGFIPFITALFILLEIRSSRKTNINTREVENMRKTNIKRKRNINRRGVEMDWKNIGKKVGIGVGFALLAFLISGDSSSIVIGLLVMYLEFRLGR